mmetsp:Transcript_17279/g.40924  ORF Transcript_17279/g.40924 Transcript_17279/m.40924 type:complete len:100 (-) Transcript_17279:2806-3105(-)
MLGMLGMLGILGMLGMLGMPATLATLATLGTLGTLGAVDPVDMTSARGMPAVGVQGARDRNSTRGLIEGMDLVPTRTSLSVACVATGLCKGHQRASPAG